MQLRHWFLESIGVVVGTLFILCVLGYLTCGCYHVPPRAPLGAAPPTAEQVSACKTELALKNWGTILAAGFGGAGSVTAGAAADIQGNRSAQVGVEIGAVSAAVIGVAFVIVQGVESNKYGSGHCDAVLAQ